MANRESLGCAGLANSDTARPGVALGWERRFREPRQPAAVDGSGSRAVTAGPGLPDRTGFSDSRCRRCRISRVGGCTSATEPRRGLPRGMAEAVRLGSSLVANPGRRELFLVDAKPDANAQR